MSKDSVTWWGYIHENGSLQVKRFFDFRDINDAKASPFVQEVLPTIEADNREDAINKLTEIAKNRGLIKD